MPQLTSIAQTAERRIAPSAITQIDGASAAAFGAAIGTGLEKLGAGASDASNAILAYQRAKAKEADQTAEFDRQAQAIAFGTAENQRLTESAQGLEGPAQDFTKGYMAEFDQRADQFIAAVPEQHKAEWRAKMASMRSGVAGDALKTELGQRTAWFRDTIKTGLTDNLNAIESAPGQFEARREEGRRLILASGLSAQEKQEQITDYDRAAAIAVATGDVQQDPKAAIPLLGMVDHQTALEAVLAAKTGGAGTPLPGGGTAGFANPVRGTPEQVIPRGGHYGDARKRKDGSARTHDGVDVPRAEGTAIRSGAGSGAATVAHSPLGGNIVTIDHGGGVVTKYMHLSRVDVRTGQRVSGDDVLGAVGHTGDATGPHLHYEVWVGGHPVDPTALAGKALPASAPARAVAAAPAPAVPVAGTLDEQFDAAFAGGSPGRVVDPRYAAMSYQDRLQIGGQAQAEVDRREQVAYQGDQAAHGEWLDNFLGELLDGKRGRTDIDAARQPGGPLRDFNEVSQAFNVVEHRERQAQAANDYAALVHAADGPLNPFDPDARKAADAAAEQQAQVKGANGQPIGLFQASVNVWKKTGIMPKSGAQLLRGGMVSTDPATVATAAGVAANMLATNPNAFAGVEGHEDIEKGASLYSHLVDELGMDAGQAAQAVARRNVDVTPEKQHDTAVFRGRLRKQPPNISSVLGAEGGFFSSGAGFVSPAQADAARQDYIEIATEHYSINGDPAAAKAFAAQQLKKLYGVVDSGNGEQRLMKYPPTHAYPPVGGSHHYLFAQARADIKGATGKDVSTDDLWFMPVAGGVTAEAFRAGDRPVPYLVYFWDRSGDQPVLGYVPQPFVGDPTKAQQDRARVDQQDFERKRVERQKRPAAGVLPPNYGGAH